MPKKKPSDRIADLKAFLSTQEDRLAKIKVVQTIKTKIHAAEKEIEILEATEAERKKEEELEAIKVAADQKRKADKRAKILWGAGLQLIDVDEAARIRAKILGRLNARDREWMQKYITENKITLFSQEPMELQEPRPEDTTPILSEPVDPAAVALLRTLNQLDSQTISLIESEFLGGSNGADRRVLEVLFAALGEKHSAEQV